MNKSVFQRGMYEINSAYLNRFPVNSSILETWYKYFEEFDDDVFIEAVRNYIVNEKQPPVLSDLLGACKKTRLEFKKREEEKEKELEDEELISDEEYERMMREQYGEDVYIQG